MTAGKKRTAAQAWDALEQMATDDEVDRVLSLSDEELDAELAKGGADPQKVRAHGEALAARMVEKGRRVEEDKAPPRLVRVRWVAWLAAAAVSGSAATFAVVSANPGLVAQPPSLQPHPAPSPAELRDEGLTACDHHDWALCLELLDRAKALDPQGDTTPHIQDARSSAHKALGRP
jgi:hypothetical protein